MTDRACTFMMCLDGLHSSCIRYGPPPNADGGTRVECACPCHSVPGADPEWSPAAADRMAEDFAGEGWPDPRVEQILDGKFEKASA